MNDADKDKYAYKSPEQLINEGLVAPPSLAMDEHGRCIYSDAFKAWARGRFPLMNVEAGNKDLDMAWVGWNAALAHRDANRLIMVDGQVYDQRDVERLVREREQYAEVMREVGEVLEEIEDFIRIAHVHCDDNPIFGLGDSDLYTRRFYAADAAAARLREKVGEA